ncbi:MAG: GNAT family N-acetyltransferase [Epsilonproteobacteria bacterium]|nr:hypothetical protein [Campylobacterota bacterium]NPA56661.1 GNAT family N-acetyltransferase [Campylobacterota bacterium]
MNRVEFLLPSRREFWPVAQKGLEALYQLLNFPEKEGRELSEAVEELFVNAVVHGYRDEVGEVKIEVEIFDNAIAVGVEDRGEPFDERLFRAVPLDPEKRGKGFNRIYNLVDNFNYANLGLQGKRFTVVKYAPFRLRLQEEVPFYSDIGEDREEVDRRELAEKLVVRPFKPGDEVWIPKLIYRNYGYTYFKDTFYYPQKIRELEERGEILSIVAEIEGKIVGHFAMVRLPRSNIAEIGVAVVDPQFKGLGIMKRMFHLLIKEAKGLELSAIFGEAVTFHPYSQRANARFGLYTTALMLGDLHQMVQLKDHPYPFREKRGAVAVEYKILRPFVKRIAIPERYRRWVERSYNLLGVRYRERRKRAEGSTKISHELNRTFNIATLVIDGAGEDFERHLKREFDSLVAKHPDMIYADINLEMVEDIDRVVEILRSFDFFYCGIAFLRRFEWDYLKMQFELSENIEEQDIRCYTDLCRELHRFILEDKASLHKEA